MCRLKQRRSFDLVELALKCFLCRTHDDIWDAVFCAVNPVENSFLYMYVLPLFHRISILERNFS